MEETPRSNSTRSASSCSLPSCRSASTKSMRRKRVSHTAEAENSSKRCSAVGSRSTQTSVPPAPRRWASSRAWPPAPNVQSMATSPGAGAVKSSNSPASTGTWELFMSRRIAKLLRHLLDVGVERILLGAPALPAPDLQVIAHACHDDLLLDSGVGQERRGKRHASGRVEVRVEGVRLVEARQPPGARAHRVQPAQGPLDDRFVSLGRPDPHARLRILCQNNSGRECCPEPGGNAEPVLRVQRVFVVPAECQVPSRSRVRTEVAEWEEP